MKKTLAVFLLLIVGVFHCGVAGAITTFIPHITFGSLVWDDHLQANNNTWKEAIFTLNLYGGGEQVYSEVHTVPALGHLLIDLKSLSSDAETGMVEYEESGLVFRVSYENEAGGVAEFKTIDSLEDGIGLYFSDFTPAVVAKGAAIANMGETAADVTLLAIGAEDVQGEFSTRIEPKERIASIHSVWFPEVPFSMIDSIIAISDSDSQSLCGIAISSDADTSHLLCTPGVPAVVGLRAETLAEASSIRGANGIYFGAEDQLYVASVVGRCVTVMDPDTGEIVRKLGPEEGVEGPDDLAFGPDGSLYFTSFLTGEVGRLMPDGTVLKQFVGPGVNPITFSDDGRLFVALDFIGDALYEMDPELTDPPRLILENLGFLNGFDFGPDGLLYGPIWMLGKVVRIDVDAEQPAMETVADGFSIASAVKFNSKGELHVTDQFEGAVIRVDIETGEKTTVGTGLHKADNLAFDSADRLFVSSADDGFVGQVLEDGTTRTVNPGGMMFMGGLCFQDGTLFVADLFNLRQLDPVTGSEIATQKSYMGRPGLTTAMTVAGDDGRLILTSWFARTVQIWDPEKGEAVANYTDFGIPLNAIRFQGDLIVADAATTSLIRANGENPSDRTTLASELILPVGLAADNDNLWVGDWATGGIYQVVKAGVVLESPEPVASGLANPEGMVLGNDGKLLVVETGAGRVASVDVNTGETASFMENLELGLPGMPEMPPTWIFCGIAQAPDGALFISGDRGGVLYRISEK